MTIIYKSTDLIDLKIQDLVFSIRPLRYKQRVDIMSCLSNQSGTIVENAAKATFLTMKYTIRKVTGAFLLDGSPYEIELGEDDNVSDDCIDDLLNMASDSKLGPALHNFLKGIPSKLIDPNTGEELKGVEIVKQEGVPKK